MGLRFKLLLLSFTVHFYASFAQVSTKAIDSINVVARRITSFDSSNALLKEEAAKAKAINYTNGIVDAAIRASMNLHNHGKFEESIRITSDWEKLTLATNDNERIAHLYALRGNSYARISFFEKSLAWLQLAKAYVENVNDSDKKNYGLGRIYGIKGYIFKNQDAIPHHLDSALYYR